MIAMQVIPCPCRPAGHLGKRPRRTNVWHEATSPAREVRLQLRLFRGPHGSHVIMQSLQGDTLVVIIAASAFLAGVCCERIRAKLARQAWQKRRRSGKGGVPAKPEAFPVTDPAEQLRLVMGARFAKRRLLSRSEAYVRTGN
jgi:hypothetical protein